ncbi:hypothetical protein SAMD00019534_100020 [Acytostelium subglobosum LB1]|uniref:hypothetical protein n=1 Tax=Acytostelium subglobosum LB1 TaxID=1410327 RepID=UPI000644C260|nr:hypothetical protein SAMD00019534_100020 [Acytostelium subglobosum LB1]GAM26827.1 hypothetical protein SAMD00019534_100020 [Acytostelium subglobosum LB1]|eukprot:XP_012750095.1 hypothetical protein SAMD00019534_100020 [Acytostelium subglobosum LB1]
MDGFVPCYCDPVFPFGVGTPTCPKGGCLTYGIFFFLAFSVATAECIRRMWIQRKQWRTAVYISNVMMMIANLCQSLRMVLVLAKVTEIYSTNIILLFGVGFYFASYLWILISWCDIITSVNFNKSVQITFKCIRWAIVFLFVMHFVGWIIAFSIWWPYQVSNIWIASYGFGVSVGYFALGFFIWLEYRSVSNISAHGKNAEKTYRKIVKLVKLSSAVVVTALIMTGVMFGASYILPTTNEQFVGWLFITRSSFVLFTGATLVFFIPSNNKRLTSTSSGTKGSSSEWSEKMNKLEFASGESKEEPEPITPGGDLESNVSSTPVSQSFNVEIGQTGDGTNGSSNV